MDMYINGHDHCLEHLSNDEGYVELWCIKLIIKAMMKTFYPKCYPSSCSSIQFLTSGGGSKAWKNDIHYKMHNETTHFYHDGQGFMSIEIRHDTAKIAFYDVSGKTLYSVKLSGENSA